VFNVHFETAKHDCNEPVQKVSLQTSDDGSKNLPSCTGTPNHVEVIAWFRWCNSIDGFHELLEDEKSGQSTNTPSVDAK
jgi:hypothetical protein